ncbi:TRAP transporter small permease [Photobacterium atrarenae]|uniref:TRAP transporter small permease protein n=1 Tax=Photobacterium atrarenae TaxID=865757 RepID=A0ABY5GNN1_9GAMM|nr:TRAP transporter small permease subunit [Photobacterium atrarenae]UTV30736.1 TRAP transporter small permease subunit [Photobacterium atrarenae]
MNDSLVHHDAPAFYSVCDFLEILLRFVMISSVISLSLLMFFQVILRYVFDSPFTGIEEVALLLGVWVYFSGMAYVTKTKEHITGGVIHLLVKKQKHIEYIKLFGYVVSLVALLFFSYLAIEYVLKIYDRGRLSTNLGWPRWVWFSSMIFGFIISSLYLTLDIFRDLREVYKQEDK